MPVSSKLQADIGLGQLHLAGGIRVAALPAAFLPALHDSLLEQFADHAQDVLYRCGYDWGLQEMAQFGHRLRTDLGGRTDLWQMDAKFILESWWGRLAETGWGTCTFDLTSQPQGVTVAELRGSAIAAAWGKSDQPVCHLYAGLFAAALSFYDRIERHATEVECSSMAGNICRFVIAPGPSVDSAETLRQQGVSSEEIIRRLR